MDATSFLRKAYHENRGFMFQGEPFAEEDYCDAIASVQQAMDSYDPAVIGDAWDDSNPRIQFLYYFTKRTCSAIV